MSIVSVVASNDFISVMTDGRIVDQNNQILDENFDKIKAYADNLFFSAWGSKAVFDDISSVLDSQYKLYGAAYVDEATKAILETANKSIYANHPFILIWGGKNKEMLKICQLRTPKKQLESMNLVESQCISLMGTDKSYAFEFLELKLSGMYGTNIDVVLEAQKNTIEYVSTKDSTVNNTIFSKLIQL